MSASLPLPFLALNAALLAAGCSPHLAYEAAQPDTNSPDKAGALRFTLQDAVIAIPRPARAEDAQRKTNADAASPPVDACKRNGSVGEDGRGCFAGVSSPTIVATALHPDGDYLARPKDILPSLFFRTSISGVPVDGENFLYQKVTINLQDNLSRTITSVGTGIATGFSLGGPIGAAIGGTLGVAVAAASNSTWELSLRPPAGAIADFVCPDSRRKIDLDALTGLRPALGLPAALPIAESRPFLYVAPSKQDQIDQPRADKEFEGCWTPLPNTLLLNEPPPLSPIGAGSAAPAASGPRKPRSGDGWFYRIVVRDKPADHGGHPAKAFILGTGPGPSIDSDQFPASYCRKEASLEIIWWTELSKASGMITQRTPGTVSVVRFKLSPGFADPEFVTPVNIAPRGGTITFKTPCGAISSSGPGPDYSADWNALNTQVNTLSKALTSAP